jgi:hypothetical protein
MSFATMLLCFCNVAIYLCMIISIQFLAMRSVNAPTWGTQRLVIRGFKAIRMCIGNTISMDRPRDNIRSGNGTNLGMLGRTSCLLLSGFYSNRSYHSWGSTAEFNIRTMD